MPGYITQVTQLIPQAAGKFAIALHVHPMPKDRPTPKYAWRMVAMRFSSGPVQLYETTQQDSGTMQPKNAEVALTVAGVMKAAAEKKGRAA
ncbi:MAG: hypothetical protein ACYC28_15490 [Longimicrobiales bacterium]